MKQTRQSKKKKKGRQDGFRIASIAAIATILAAGLGSGITYWTAQSSQHHDEVMHQQDALRTACLDSLKVQEGEVSLLSDMLDDLTILNDLGKFQKDVQKLNNSGSEGQPSELYLAAPQSVHDETTRFVNTVNDYAIPALLCLAAVPSPFRVSSPEAKQAAVAINLAQTSIAKSVLPAEPQSLNLSACQGILISRRPVVVPCDRLG